MPELRTKSKPRIIGDQQISGVQKSKGHAMATIDNTISPTSLVSLQYPANEGQSNKVGLKSVLSPISNVTGSGNGNQKVGFIN